jgi:uncharacterized protein (TIGR02271 family)
MNNSMTIEALQDAQGVPVLASDGDKIGSVEEIFYDDETGKPEWVGVGTGFFGTKRVLVPVEPAEMTGDALLVPYAKEHVKDSPDIDGDEISQETERELYAYYGLEYSERRSGSGLPEGGLDTGLDANAPDTAGDTTAGPATVTRSEEELRVGTRGVEAGRARLRKWVETEPVETDVELRRETAHVTRQPIDQPVSGAEIGEEEIEVPLRAEEAVAQKQTVAKERIRLEKDVESERKTVSDEVRKERVDVAGDVEGSYR